jgi:hypothetical protein
VVKVDESIGGPQRLLQLLSSDEVSGPSQEHLENLEGLAWNPQAHSVLAEFLGVNVGLKGSKADQPGSTGAGLI